MNAIGMIASVASGIPFTESKSDRCSLSFFTTCSTETNVSIVKPYLENTTVTVAIYGCLRYVSNTTSIASD